MENKQEVEQVRKQMADVFYRKDFNSPECFPNRETGLSKYERTILYKAEIDQILAIPELCIKAADPQAEMCGTFLDMGWTPPDELKTKIEEAKKQEGERMWQEIPRRLLLELKTELPGYSQAKAALAFERVIVDRQALEK